jgi:sulfhydrogenase subunit beta (sulfur reductase)
MQTRSISRAQVDALLETMKNQGTEIWVPQKKRQQVDFSPMRGLEDITYEYIRTSRSAKSVFFPEVEELLSYCRDGAADLAMQDRDLHLIPQVLLFGTRPCDAAGIGSLKAVFTKDYQDSIFMKRQEKTTVISISCASCDNDCFCTSVGIAPGDTTGSDILLTKMGSGDYLAEILTDKGEAVVSFAPELFGAAPSVIKEEYLAQVAVKFDQKTLQEKLAGAFEHACWQQVSLACIGCGACAYVCPVCSCFDIQDEGSQKKGKRVRSWDACGLAHFTLHASGHNPRHLQSERWRQRVLHKFSYMPGQLQVLGCVGCGRCSRACPADMNLVEQIEQLVSVL